MMVNLMWWITLSNSFSLPFHGGASQLQLCFLSLFSFKTQKYLLCFSFWASTLIKVWLKFLCNSAITPKHVSLIQKHCTHPCPVMIFPDLVNRWAFSLWILLFSFSDFSFNNSVVFSSSDYLYDGQLALRVPLLNHLLQLLLAMRQLKAGSEDHTGVCLQNEIF